MRYIGFCTQLVAAAAAADRLQYNNAHGICRSGDLRPSYNKQRCTAPLSLADERVGDDCRTILYATTKPPRCSRGDDNGRTVRDIHYIKRFCDANILYTAQHLRISIVSGTKLQISKNFKILFALIYTECDTIGI